MAKNYFVLIIPALIAGSIVYTPLDAYASTTFVPTEIFEENSNGTNYQGIRATQDWFSSGKCQEQIDSTFDFSGIFRVYHATSTTVNNSFTTFDSGMSGNSPDNPSIYESIWCTRYSPGNTIDEPLTRVISYTQPGYSTVHLIPDGIYVWAYTLQSDLVSLADSFFYQIFKVTGGIPENTALTISSDIATSTTLGGDGQVYIISGNVHIDSGVTLTLEPGSVVKFDTATSSSLIVDGTLDALGDRNDSKDSWDPIVFTSLKDDLIGNPDDTNGDGNSTVGSSGDWGGIVINSDGIANLKGIILRYGGAGFGAGIYNNGGVVDLASSTISYNGSYGIYNGSGTTTAREVDLGFQHYGFYLNSGSSTLTATSTIHDNDLYGVYNNTGISLDAENNYWATSTGPSAAYGSNVYGPVDYTPYISTLHYVLDGCVSGGNSCASVVNHLLPYQSDGSYSSELSDSISTWQSLGKISFISTTTGNKLEIASTTYSDLSWKGNWSSGGGQTDDQIFLNSYYLQFDSTEEKENTITHELGHAQGLLHSYSGNIMFQNQSSQTTLGSQDLLDYYYLWP